MIIVLLVFGARVSARDAPVTTVGSAITCPGESISIPIKVDNFTNITSISLDIEYDPGVMSYQSYTPNGQLTTLIVNDMHISGNLHKIMVVWGEITPKTFVNGTSLATLTFSFIAGTTTFVFNNTVNFGGDCEYADENGDPMTDTPTADFYHDGWVTEVPAQLELSDVLIVNGQSACYTASQSIIAAVNETFFTVETGGAVTMTAAQNILLLPGTSVAADGYLKASVSDQCVTCYSSPLQKPAGPMQKEAKPGDPVSIWTSDSFFSVDPNPTNGKFTLRLDALNSAVITVMHIYNAVGNKVLSEKIQGVSKKEFSLENQPTGVYIIRVLQGGQAGTAKIVKL